MDKFYAMARFVHIDQSLSNIGGHEYNYAASMLLAAENAGYRAILASNRRFRRPTDFPETWTVHSEFPTNVHKFHANNGPNTGSPIARHTRFGCRLLQWSSLVRKRRRHSGFARACHRLFNTIGIQRDDLLYFATFSDSDISGLMDFLRQRSDSHIAPWHIQFHFDWEGSLDIESDSDCHPMSAWQTTLAGRLHEIKRQLPNHRIHFYGTTAELTSLYNRVSNTVFHHLPFAVEPSLDHETRQNGNRLRVTCAGCLRPEKGARMLASLVQGLASDSNVAPHIELVAQLSKRKMVRLGIHNSSKGLQRDQLKFVRSPHPLPLPDYHNLIHQTDIGLFLYDARSYRRRCSGILQEMLAAGKPVLVPAGSWLAQQIVEPNERHVSLVQQRSRVVRTQHLHELAHDEFTRSGICFSREARGENSNQSARKVFECTVPTSANMAVLKLRWQDQTPLATLLSLDVQQVSHDGHLIGRHSTILSPPYEGNTRSVMIRVAPGTSHVRLRLDSKWNVDRFSITDATWCFLQTADQMPTPLGMVGLPFSDPMQIPELLRDIIDHYGHYSKTAQQFADSYRQTLHPSNTVAHLALVGTIPDEHIECRIA